jgi:hypothetical protein
MRLFHGTFGRDESTPDRTESVRWTAIVDRVPFKLYINRNRIQRMPPPPQIEVSIFADESKLYDRLLRNVGRKCVSELTSEDKAELRIIGVDDDQLRISGDDAIFGAAFKPVKGHLRTKTVRYNAGKKGLEFGDPYIPQSIFASTFPRYLLFLVRWATEHAE